MRVEVVETVKEKPIKSRRHATQMAYGNYRSGYRWFAVFAVLLYLGWSRNEFKLRRKNCRSVGRLHPIDAGFATVFSFAG